MPMKLASYFKQEFPKHLSQLHFRPVKQVLKDLFHDPHLVLFGGRDWVDIEQDLAPIPQAQRAHCVYALLAIVLTDRCMQTHFKAAYPAWRQATAYPKFGWSGFGLHHENPYKLISVAESSGLVEPLALHALLPEFVEFFLELVSTHFARELPTVNVRQLLCHILNDDINRHRQGTVLPLLHARASQAWLAPEALQAPATPRGALATAGTDWLWRAA